MERLNKESTDLNRVYPFGSNRSLRSEDDTNENMKAKWSLKINNFAVFFFPFVTTVFNFVYFSLSLLSDTDVHV